MITTNDYQIHRVRVCIDCLERDDFGPDMNDEGELTGHSAFSRVICDLCESELAGERFLGTQLVRV